MKKISLWFALLTINLYSFNSVAESLTLQDLRPNAQTQAPSNAIDAALQLELDRRHEMLETHQTLAYVTWGLMAATLLTAEQNEKNSIHQTLGGATAASYFTTMYYSTFAPDPLHKSGTTGWNVKIHKTLRWVHLPLMILTPIAGIMADKQKREGKELSGLAEQKSAIATAAFASYTIAGTIMFFEF